MTRAISIHSPARIAPPSRTTEAPHNSALRATSTAQLNTGSSRRYEPRRFICQLKGYVLPYRGPDQSSQGHGILPRKVLALPDVSQSVGNPCQHQTSLSSIGSFPMHREDVTFQYRYGAISLGLRSLTERKSLLDSLLKHVHVAWTRQDCQARLDAGRQDRISTELLTAILLFPHCRGRGRLIPLSSRLLVFLSFANLCFTLYSLCAISLPSKA